MKPKIKCTKYFFISIIIIISIYFLYTYLTKKEHFEVQPLLLDGIYAMRKTNDKWCSDNNGKVNCYRNKIGKLEKFELTNIGNGMIQLKGGRIGKVCRLKYDRNIKSYNMVCDKETSNYNPKTVWKLERKSGGKFYLKSLDKLGRCGVYHNKRLICQNDVASFFKNGNFRGNVINCPIGNYNSSELNRLGWNDKISSFAVPSGLTIKIYKNPNFGSLIGTYIGPMKIASLGGDNNKISSIKVGSTGVRLFDQHNQKGKNIALTYGNYDLPRLELMGMPNDRVSSIDIPYGFKVTLYKDVGYKKSMGKYTGPNKFNLGGWKDDKLSSIKVQRHTSKKWNEFQIRLISLPKKKLKPACPNPNYVNFNPMAFKRSKYNRIATNRDLNPGWKLKKSICSSPFFYRQAYNAKYDNQQFHDLIISALSGSANDKSHVYVRKANKLKGQLRRKMDYIYKIACEIKYIREKDFNKHQQMKHKRNMPSWFGLITEIARKIRKYEIEDYKICKRFYEEINQAMHLSRHIMVLYNSDD